MHTYITVDGRRYFIGVFQTEQLAHIACVNVKSRIEEAEKLARQTLMEQVIQERSVA